ncbi:MAG: hypothetical protein HUJ22_02210 [Gracilimonas sp.]|uniref:hypothetical protein n=1 Tax=Gracilimonas sp. TaxID=1974203 RepID=UPI0019BBBCA0|nr:hypothetical protein [Gracilimonas sp.]MBD3615358.1 hypothetical protein [Gracilimonas sp.]
MYEPIYYTATSLLIFNKQRVLKRIKCPFRVIPVKDEGGISQSDIYFVNRVYPSEEHRLIYEIEGKKYPYNTFKIVLQEDK